MIHSILRFTIAWIFGAAIVLGFSPVGGSSAAIAGAFSFGRSGSGQTGLGISGISDTTVATPIIATHLGTRQIAQVAAGESHSLILTTDGTVFSFGSDGMGRTGLGTIVFGGTTVAEPIHTTNLAGKITQIAAGGSQSLAIDEHGTVYSFGWNFWGQTGQNTPTDGTVVATPINATNLGGKRFKQVSAGFAHSLILAEDGTVFSFGLNLSGRTGFGIGPNNGTYIATQIDTTNLSGKNIIQVSAGSTHSLLLADDGTVFSFGDNFSGRTGRGLSSGSTVVATPIDATELAGKHIVQISAGGTHSLLLADDGTVFSFGWNIDNGGSGLGTQFGSSRATPIDDTNLAGKTITQVEAGLFHSLLLAGDGTVFSFGENRGGKTGLGTTVGDTYTATQIDMTNLAGLRVIDISAAVEHSLLLAVPEPAALVLLAIGTVAMLPARGARRRTR